MRAPRVIAVVLTMLVAAAAGWAIGRPALARRHDVAVRRSLYRAFPVFPGAIKADEHSFELKSDGVGTGDYGLTVTYRLSASTRAAEVIDFFRHNLPAGWTEASDATCALLHGQMAPPPVATVPPGSAQAGTVPPIAAVPKRLVLMPEDGQLTVFAPEKAPGDAQRWTGVTFKVNPGRGIAERLTLTEATFTCVPG